MNGTNYVTIGYNFLQLAINSIEEMQKQGNKSLISINSDLSDDEAWLKYDELTKWNDFNIAIPVLYNFFHGVELILKGLILKCGGSLEKKNHNLNWHFNKLKKCPKPPDKNVIDHFEKILFDNGFNDYFKENKATSDSFYEVFRYPERKNGDEIKYWLLRGKEKDGLEKFEKIKILASELKIEIIKWNKSNSNSN